MFALPSYSLSKILRRSESHDEVQEQRMVELANTLNQIRWVDVAVANVEYNMSPAVSLPKFGFGHLVPSSEPSNVLGIVYDSCSFPQHDRCNILNLYFTEFCISFSNPVSLSYTSQHGFGC